MLYFHWRRRPHACHGLLSLLVLLAATLAVPALSAAKTGTATRTTRVTLPVEVMGRDGTTQSVGVYVPTSQPVVALSMQVHGLSYDNKAGVQINNGPWMTLSNSAVKVAEPGKSFGGIGGAYSTLTLTIPLTAGQVRTGANTLAFRFNHTDGISIGFRVLAFNFLTAAGQAVLPSTSFVQDNPNTWTAPHPDAASIAAGSQLWHSAPLVKSSQDSSSMLATCADCHSEDGRDLKYFGYSNYSIIQRAQFHGLSQLQGEQIASYIRTLPVATQGRPWNPPYQPGPGMDAKPVSAWAAGAGLAAVLPNDAAMLPYLFPNGITKDVASTSGTLNMRELPIALPLPDWNRWLPRIHPKDAWGETFTGSQLNKLYNNDGDNSWQWGSLRGHLSDPVNSANFIANNQSGLKVWLGGWQTQAQIFNTTITQAAQADNWQGNDAQRVYSVGLWKLVKTWEMMQEFGLEDKAPLIYGAGGETHSWLDGPAFQAAPFMAHIPESANFTSGALPPAPLEQRYLDNGWYHLQFVLNAGSRHREGWTPVDWGYSSGRMKDLANLTHQPEALRLTAMVIKGMQQSDTNGTVDSTLGWYPKWVANLADLTWADPNYGFGNVLADQYSADPATNTRTRVQVLSAVLGAWQDKMAQYPAQAYYNAGFASPSDTPQGDANLLGSTYYFLRDMKTMGADPNLLSTTQNWAKTVWPSTDWDNIH